MPPTNRPRPPVAPDEDSKSQSVYDDLLRMADDSRQILFVKSTLLLPSFGGLFKLLNTSYDEFWESCRRENPRLPVGKTMAKFREMPKSLPYRSTFLRIEASFTSNQRQAMRALLEEEIKLDYLWPPGCEWQGLFGSGFFAHSAANSFWISFTKDAGQLNGVAIPAAKTLRAKLFAYAGSATVKRFGCPAARTMLSQRLGEMQDDALLKSDPVTELAVLADLFSVLMRLAAWIVADLVVDNWEVMVRDEMTDVVPLQSLLPMLDSATGEWSCPMESVFEMLAKKAGWTGKAKARTFLGNLWANANPQYDPTSRKRLLRDWLRYDRNRPEFHSLKALAKVVMDERVRLAGMPKGDHAYETWVQAWVLRFAEILYRLMYDLRRKGCSAELITGIMGVYSEEYRVAREHLGKPMQACRNA